MTTLRARLSWASMVLGAIIVVLLSVATGPAALATNNNRSISHLSAAWWQWAWANGFPDTGVFADGSVDCSAGQQGNVWFLAGKGAAEYDPSQPPGGLTGDRTCIDPIPAGKSLFLPLVNFEFYNPDDNFCGDDKTCTIAEKRKILDGLFSDVEPGVIESRACYVTAAVDGQSVTSKGWPIARVQSPPYQGAGAAAGDPHVVAEGFYVLLPPLKPGEHTLDFAGFICAFDGFTEYFGSQVTYKLTVGGQS